MIEKLYTVEEVAELASVTGRTIRNYLKSGRLVGRKIGGQWRFPETEVQRLLTGVDDTDEEILPAVENMGARVSSPVYEQEPAVAVGPDPTPHIKAEPAFSPNPPQPEQVAPTEEATAPGAYRPVAEYIPPAPLPVREVPREVLSAVVTPRMESASFTEKAPVYSQPVQARPLPKSEPAPVPFATGVFGQMEPARPKAAPTHRVETPAFDERTPLGELPPVAELVYQAVPPQPAPPVQQYAPAAPAYIPEPVAAPHPEPPTQPTYTQAPAQNINVPSSVSLSNTQQTASPPVPPPTEAPQIESAPPLPPSPEASAAKPPQAPALVAEQNQPPAYPQDGHVASSNRDIPLYASYGSGAPFLAYPGPVASYANPAFPTPYGASLYGQVGPPALYPAVPYYQSPYPMPPMPQQPEAAPAPKEELERQIPAVEKTNKGPIPNDNLDKLDYPPPTTRPDFDEEPNLSEVGKKVTKFISEVHDCSSGPLVCTVIDLYQPLELARNTIERLTGIAKQESENGILCQAFVEYDERFYVARYTLFGSSAFLYRCVKILG